MKRLLQAILVLVLAIGTEIPTVFGAFDPVGQDIDIFLANPNFLATRPNVLIMLDNGANWSASSQDSSTTPAPSKWEIEKPILYNVVNGLSSDFNVGLMLFPDQNTCNGCPDGGYVRYAVRQMTSTNKDKLKELVNSLDKNNDKGPNNVAYGLWMYEAYTYFAGISSLAGHLEAKRDYPNNPGTAGSQTWTPSAASLPNNAFASSGSTTYVSPITDGCQKNFMIVLSNGVAGDTSSANATAQGYLSGLVGKNPPDTLLIGGHEQVIWMDEFAQFMANGDCNASFTGKQSVITYTIDIDRVTTGNGPDHTTLLQSAATVGKGKYFSVSTANGGSQITAALQQIFQEIQAVNSVFAAVTLPVDVNVRGTNLNQVYIGVFRPDPNRSPRWFGNLKLYDLAVDSATQTLFLADANGTRAENAQTGFIFNTAQSFWTSSSRDAGGTTGTGYWQFRSPFDAADVGKDDDLPDGDVVEKGGAAERLRKIYPDSVEVPNRKLYTCTTGCTAGNPGSSLSVTQFATGNADVTAGDLGTYVRKSVTGLTSSGTLATATVTSHGFSTGNTVTIEGASPSAYNGDFTITNTGTDTFTYALSASLSGTTATANATGHGLNFGDNVTVTGSSQSNYNVTNVPITKVNDNTFTYSMGGTATGTSSGHTVKGIKTVTSLTGYATGGSSSLITATVPSHGYTSGTILEISGALPNEFNISTMASPGITVTGTDTFTYTVSSAVSGSSTLARATSASPHGFSVGNTVTIAGSTLGAYNGSVTVATVPDPNTFTYAFGTSQSLDPSQTGITATKTGISLTPTSMVHSNNSGVVTVNFSSTHNLSAPTNVTISNASQSGYNGIFPIATVPSTTSFTYRTAIADATTPASGTITATKGGTTITATSVTHPTVGNFTSQSTATATFASAHGFSNGDSITIAGASDPVYNGTFTISTSGPASTTFTYTNTGAGNQASPATAVGGTTLNVSTQTVINLSSLRRVVAATPNPTIYASKTLSVTSITSQTSATGTITAGRKSDADATDRANLINWVRGLDNFANENSNIPLVANLPDVRPSIHGDVLHSRPAVVNYNRNGDNNDVFVFYGANDGILHAVQGGTAANGGNEAWGFIPPEFFGKLNRLRQTTPTITASNPRDYFFDGPLALYLHDLNGNGVLDHSAGDKVLLFVGMRRGGRWIYALDVSDPSDPKFMWKVGCPNVTDNTGCTAGFEKLGQTWSSPQVGFLKAYANPVLIFGAGYDPMVEDFQPCLLTANTATSVTAQTGGSVTFTSSGSCTYSGTTPTSPDRTIGQGIFIVDAFTGALKRYFGPKAASSTVTNVADMTYAVPADVVVLNRDRDTTRTITGRENVPTGYLDRIYAVDTGGNVWRIDVDNADPTQWRVAKFASISGTTLPDKRKFLFPPDVVFSSDANGRYDAVLVGSGDREHPFDATITNRFYMFKDREVTNVTNATAAPNTINGNAYDGTTNPDGLFNASNNCLQDATVCNSTQQAQAANDLLGSRGWFLTFGSGEKAVGGATTIAGTTFFNTNQPSATAGGGACSSNLGVAREYAISFKDATATTNLGGTSTITTEDRSQVHSGGGFLPSPVPVIVQIGTKKYQAVISGTSVVSPGGLKLESRIRTYWFRKIE